LPKIYRENVKVDGSTERQDGEMFQSGDETFPSGGLMGRKDENDKYI
jgi:hypothetical protein